MALARVAGQVYTSLMEFKLTVTTYEEQAKADREYWLSRTPEERVSHVEDLRIEAGKFLYEYPSRLQRVITVTRNYPKTDR